MENTERLIHYDTPDTMREETIAGPNYEDIDVNVILNETKNI